MGSDQRLEHPEALNTQQDWERLTVAEQITLALNRLTEAQRRSQEQAQEPMCDEWDRPLDYDSDAELEAALRV